MGALAMIVTTIGLFGVVVTIMGVFGPGFTSMATIGMATFLVGLCCSRRVLPSCNGSDCHIQQHGHSQKLRNLDSHCVQNCKKSKTGWKANGRTGRAERNGRQQTG